MSNLPQTPSRRRAQGRSRVVMMTLVAFVFGLIATSCSVGSDQATSSTDVEVLAFPATPTPEPDDRGTVLERSVSATDDDPDDGLSVGNRQGFAGLPDPSETVSRAQLGFELVSVDTTDIEPTGEAEENDNSTEPTPEPTATPPPATPTPEPAQEPEPSEDSDADLDDWPEADPDEQSGPIGAMSSAGESPLADRPFGPNTGAVWVASAKASTSYVQVYDGPDGNPVTLLYEYLDGTTTDYQIWNPTYFGGVLSLLVVSGTPDDEFVQVQVPIRPTGSTAWVRSDEFTFAENNFYVEIDVATNNVRVWDGAELIVESAAVTGRSDRPTPVLRTYIDEKLPGPNTAYGPWMLTLAAFSESLNTFGAGLPKLALHGTNQPGLMGQYASSGCIRLPNNIISLLAETVPVGTRVDIVRSS